MVKHRWNTLDLIMLNVTPPHFYLITNFYPQNLYFSSIFTDSFFWSPNLILAHPQLYWSKIWQQSLIWNQSILKSSQSSPSRCNANCRGFGVSRAKFKVFSDCKFSNINSHREIISTFKCLIFKPVWQNPWVSFRCLLLDVIWFSWLILLIQKIGSYMKSKFDLK